MVRSFVITEMRAAAYSSYALSMLTFVVSIPAKFRLIPAQIARSFFLLPEYVYLLKIRQVL